MLESDQGSREHPVWVECAINGTSGTLHQNWRLQASAAAVGIVQTASFVASVAMQPHQAMSDTLSQLLRFLWEYRDVESTLVSVGQQIRFPVTWK